MLAVKQWFAVLALVVLSGCAGLAEAPASELQYQQVREVDLTKDQIFDKTQEWLALTFVDSKEVIEVANRDTGKVIGQGSTDIVDMMVVTPVTMTITVEAKPERYRLTFNNYTAYYDGSPYGVSTAGAADAINEKARSLDRSLFDYLSSSSSGSDDW